MEAAGVVDEQTALQQLLNFMHVYIGELDRALAEESNPAGSQSCIHQAELMSTASRRLRALAIEVNACRPGLRVACDRVVRYADFLQSYSELLRCVDPASQWTTAGRHFLNFLQQSAYN